MKHKRILQPSPRQSYREHPSWLDYRRLLPAHACPTTEPQESIWRWRDWEIHVDEWGSDTSTTNATIVMLHGGGGHGRILAPFAGAMAQRGYRVICPDLPGYGLSRPIAGRRTTALAYRDWLQCVAALVEYEADRVGRRASGQRPIALAGYSAGGLTAWAAAQQARPGTVAGVIATTLLDVSQPDIFDSAARTSWLGAMARWWFRHASAASLRLPLCWVTPLQRMTADVALSQYFANDSLIGRRRVPLSLFASMHEFHPAQFYATHACANPGLRSGFDHTLPTGERVPVPLLLAHPAADAWTPLAHSQRFYDQLSGPKKLVLLQNAGHLPIEEPGFSTLCHQMAEFIDHLTEPDQEATERWGHG